MTSDPQPLIKTKKLKERNPLPDFIFRRGEQDTEKCLCISEGIDTDLSIGIGTMPSGAPCRLTEFDDDWNRCWAMVTFTCCSAGGGKSINTRQAIYALMEAIRKDNEEDAKQGLTERGGERNRDRHR